MVYAAYITMGGDNRMRQGELNMLNGDTRKME